MEHASLRYPKPPPPIVIIPPSSPTMFLKSRIPCRRPIRRRKRLRAARKRFFGARPDPKFPPPPTSKCPQIDDQNETISLIKEQRALRQALERRRPAPNVRVMGDEVYTEKNGEKTVPPTHFGTYYSYTAYTFCHTFGMETNSYWYFGTHLVCTHFDTHIDTLG